VKYDTVYKWIIDQIVSSPTVMLNNFIDVKGVNKRYVLLDDNFGKYSTYRN